MTALYIAAFVLAVIGIIYLLKITPDQINKDVNDLFGKEKTLKDKSLTARGKKKKNKILLELEHLHRALTETGKEKQFSFACAAGLLFMIVGYIAAIAVNNVFLIPVLSVAFAPKYRRKVFFEEKRLEIREMLRQLCQWKGVEIVEGEVCVDIHMLVSIPPKMSVSGFMGYLKGKSALMIFQKWGNMKFAYRNHEFWCKGHYVDTVGKNAKAIKEYIANQPQKIRKVTS